MLKLVKNMTFDEIVTELNQTVKEIEDKYVESLNIPVYTHEEWDKEKISKTEHNLKTTKTKLELELKQAIDKLEYEKNVAEMRFKCANEGLFEIANDPN